MCGIVERYGMQIFIKKKPGDAAFFPGDAGDAPLFIKGMIYYPYIKAVRHLRHLGKRLRHLVFFSKIFTYYIPQQFHEISTPRIHYLLHFLQITGPRRLASPCVALNGYCFF